jgi:uroporphyrinogen-III synthase
VLVTRSADSSAALVGSLAALDIDSAIVPTIEVADVNSAQVADALAAAPGAWVVATSPNGVRRALAAAFSESVDPRAYRWAVVGDESARALRRLGIEPWLPARPDGATLASTLPVARGEPVVVIRSDLAGPGLGEMLVERGARVEDLVGYRTIEGPHDSRDRLAIALDGPIDAIVAASGSAVRGLVSLTPNGARSRILATPLVCIGASTARAAREHGFSAITVADEPSTAALADAIVRALVAAWPADNEEQTATAEPAQIGAP